MTTQIAKWRTGFQEATHKWNMQTFSNTEEILEVEKMVNVVQDILF